MVFQRGYDGVEAMEGDCVLKRSSFDTINLFIQIYGLPPILTSISNAKKAIMGHFRFVHFHIEV